MMITDTNVIERARLAPTLAHLAADLGVPASTLARHYARICRDHPDDATPFPRGGSARIPGALLVLTWAWRFAGGRAAKRAHRIAEGSSQPVCGAWVGGWAETREVRPESLRCPACWPVGRIPPEPGAVPRVRVGGPCEVVARVAAGRARRLLADFASGVWVDAQTGETIPGKVRAIEWWSVWRRFMTDRQRGER